MIDYDLLLGVNTKSTDYSNNDIVDLLNQCSPKEKRCIKGFIKVLLSEG
jgi:hypothetical protein